LVAEDKIVLTADGIHHWFWPKFCWKPTLHYTKEPIESLPCLYNAVCWIHMEE
jgi:hypothetical protein